MRRKHIAPLTSLRFFAALSVVFHHFGYVPIAETFGRSPIIGPLLLNIQSMGFIGVDFFFVLSGFILAYTYLDADGRMTARARDFWMARVARIYPVYLCAFVVAALPFLWAAVPKQRPLITGVSGALLGQAWIPFSATAWNPPGWSLSAEAFFYLTFPVCVPLFVRVTRRHALLTLLALWALVLVAPTLYTIGDPDHLHASWVYSGAYLWREIVKYNPLLHWPEFLIGVSAACLFARTAPRRRQRPKRALLVATTIGAVMCLGTVVPYMLAFDGLLAPLFALLIYDVATATGGLARALSRPTLVKLGDVSYTMYILHFPLWQWLSHLDPVLFPGGGSPSIVVFLIYLLLLVATSALVFHLVERPSRRVVRRLLSGGSVSSTANRSANSGDLRPQSERSRVA